MLTRRDISLREFNTFGIDARAREMTDFDTVDELRAWLGRTDTTEPPLVLGGGSNVLFAADVARPIVRPRMGGIDVVGEEGDDVLVRVGAGVAWDDFVAWSVGAGLGGAENLSGIPGTVGAAPVQNIGAYGAEAGDVIASADGVLIESRAPLFNLPNADCGFGYRDSVFKRGLRGRAIITSVMFRLSRRARPKLGYGALRDAVASLGAPTLANIRAAVLATRAAKLPDPKEQGNAGSFFKNPEVDAAKAQELREAHPSMPQYALPDGRAPRRGHGGRHLAPPRRHRRRRGQAVRRHPLPGGQRHRIGMAGRPPPPPGGPPPPGPPKPPGPGPLPGPMRRPSAPCKERIL